MKGEGGRGYVIIHVGCEEGWIGGPRIWEANNSSTVPGYHENMNARIFAKHTDQLCRHCTEKGPQEGKNTIVVSFMDLILILRPSCLQTLRSASLPCGELIQKASLQMTGWLSLVRFCFLGPEKVKFDCVRGVNAERQR